MLEHLLASLPGWKRLRVKELLKSGRVHVNGRSYSRHDAKVSPGDEVEIRDQVEAAGRSFPYPVLYEDKWLIAINKPNGLLTVATAYEKAQTAYARVNRALAAYRERAFVVHRLDRYTSGVLLFAKTEDAQAVVEKNWGKASKVYYALVEGSPRGETGRLEHYLKENDRLVMKAYDRPMPGAVRASLSWKRVASSETNSLLRIQLETGKKNQIRAQLAALGYPIAGDRKYGAQTDPLGRLALHAAQLELPHPKTGYMVLIEAPLPSGFAL
ncbi:RluA family pseudouridine synthase [Pelagicoccus sp. SDUM812003]|nr:RluA family pseudouridine synthase [Pelagicoccus sp. SDUM812003]